MGPTRKGRSRPAQDRLLQDIAELDICKHVPMATKQDNGPQVNGKEAATAVAVTS